MEQDTKPSIVHFLDEKERADYSVAMHIGFDSEPKKQYIKTGICIALYAVLIMVWMPGFSVYQKEYEVASEDNQPIRRKVLKPPPEKPIERVQTREKKAKKVPMPDLTPDQPEPVILAEAPPEPEVLATDDWEIGIPDAPPQPQETIAMVGTPGVEPPVFTRRVPPNYPEKGVEIRLQGYVILQAVLRKDGSIDDIEVLRGLGKGKFGFEDEAIASLQQWEFLPGRHKGSPADVRMNLRVDFILN